MLICLLMGSWQRTRSLRSVEGPLSPILRSYAAFVNNEGYSYESFLTKTRFVIKFSRWLRRKQIRLRDLTREVGDDFLRSYSPHRSGDPTTLRQLLAWLRDKKMISDRALQTHERSDADMLVQEYAAYLLRERGLASTSIDVYTSLAHRFLQRACANGRSDLRTLAAQAIRNFVIQEARRHRTSKGVSLLATVLRSFLRFAHVRGYIDRPLVAAVPAVAHWSMGSIPKALPQTDVERVLAYSKRRRSPGGLRDRAILLLLARLGLRARDVMLLELEDIDWDNACIHVCGKGRRERPVPLPHEVGQALAVYLQKGRPSSSCRRVFLRARAPWRGLATSYAISIIVCRALKRAQVISQAHGAHQFRHALASSMLRRGATLTEIGQILRHRDPNTTRLYAKVDLTALRKLALPWPGTPR